MDIFKWFLHTDMGSTSTTRRSALREEEWTIARSDIVSRLATHIRMGRRFELGHQRLHNANIGIVVCDRNRNARCRIEKFCKARKISRICFGKYCKCYYF